MDLLGTRLSNRYEIVREIGRGGVGVVYLARDPLLGREVAVKLIPPEMLTDEAGERFRREARTIARMDHPSIVSVYDFGTYDGALFLVMPLLGGSTLRTVLRDGVLRLGDVVDVGIQLADALDYSHAQGIVHRDLRPENVVVARAGDAVRARLTDFGIAQVSFESLASRRPPSGAAASAACYLSPEQLEGREADARSDVYALGCVLYECVAGAPAFAGDLRAVHLRVVHEPPRPLSELGAGADADLEELLMRCMAKDPARRPQQAKEVADALKAYRQRLRESDRARPLGPRAPADGRTRYGGHDQFVGREREMAELHRRLHEVLAGESHLVLVAGEAGIGKTRLLAEVERAGADRGVRVLHGRFVGHDRAFPYQGYCEVIQELSRVEEAAPAGHEPVDWSEIADDLTRLFPLLSEVAAIAEARVEGEQAGELRRGEDATAIYELLSRAITRMAGGRPLILLLEDLHGADVSVEALQYIARRIRTSPILVVGSYRPGEVDRRHALARLVDSLKGDRRFALLQLGPFSPAEHRAYVRALLGERAVGDALAQALYAATEGNPFFAKELVRSLAESGGIAEDDAGALALASEMGLATNALPETIQQVVERQVERLPEPLREIVSIASVIGRAFDYRDLEALVDGAADLDESVERLVRAGIFEERAWSKDGLSFASRVVRDVLYSDLSRRRRRALHRRYAAHLEARFAGRLDRVYMQLLHHHSQGDVAEKAVEYAFLAAVKALDAFSATDAIFAMKTALEYLGDDEWDGDPSLPGEARLLLAAAHRVQGDIAEALKQTERAAAHFLAVEQEPQALRSLVMAAEIAWEGRKIDETQRWVDRGTELARALGESWALARLLTLAATLANLRGDYGAAKGLLDEAERLQPARGSGTEPIPRGGTVVVCLDNPIFTATEPAAVLTADDEEVLGNVFERLAVADAYGTILPALCERWEALEGGAAFRLTLRRGVTFSDGHPLTAADVKRSFERAVRFNGDRLPAVYASIRGLSAFLGRAAGEGDGLEGIVVRSDDDLDVLLDEPVPLYPALLTDVSAAIARVAPAGGGAEAEVAVGTGPFVLSSHAPERVVLARRDAHWSGRPPRVDAVEFRSAQTASEMVARFRAGELDLVRGLPPGDIERLLRDPRVEATLVDAPRKESCFVLFNASSRVAGDAAVRRALGGLVQTRALVWQTVGRSAVPATGVIPPGMLGHDPGRRLGPVDRAEAVETLRAASAGRGAQLRVAVGPNFRERYGGLLEALFESWAEHGVSAAICTPTVDSYRFAMADPDGVDVLLVRWTADYHDPDNFTYGIFHSRHGTLGNYYASAELDQIAEQARAEPKAPLRDALYRRFETLLLEAGAVIPLFHETDFRLASRAVRGLQLQNSAPFVNYAELGKEDAPAREGPPRHGGAGPIRVAVSTASVRSLDPALATTTEHSETIPNVYETLVRVDEGARVVPWLASELRMEEGGARFRFRLRDDVRFHDGRRLTARDVRYTFERLLQQRHSSNHLLLAPIRGARQLMEGTVGDLEGFRIHSATEFSVELERPLPIFAVLLTNASTAIVPEGGDRFDGGWREQCVGTGPFRVVGFEPGHRLELERHPSYWRAGYPKSERLAFHFNLDPEQTLAEFRAGRLSLASGLSPRDVEALRRDPVFASRYYEIPMLSIAYVACNTRRGPLSDAAVRRRLLGGVDAGAVVRRALGRFTKPAAGFIPPGLLGHVPGGAVGDGGHGASAGRELELTAAISAVYPRTFSTLVDELLGALRRAGARIRVVASTPGDYEAARAEGSVDLFWSIWVADYPDTDSLVHGVLHTTEGAYGRICGSAEVDRLIERGRVETDAAARLALYRELEQAVARDALLLPLFHPHTYRFAQPELDGLACRSLTHPVVAYESLRVR